MSEIVYIDGEYLPRDQAKVSVYDHGLLYGDGVFEGIRLYSGNIFRLKQHLDRLWDSAAAIMLTIPMTKDELAQVLAETCRRNNVRDAYLRIVITRGSGDLGLSPSRCPRATVICIVASVRLYAKEMYEKGMDIITAAHRRVAPDTFSSRIKSLNYLNNIMGKINAINGGVEEALMLNREGQVLEATADNVFIVRNGVITTVPVYLGALRGITRDAVVELATGAGIRVLEEPFTLYEVYTADEMFLTGTAAEVVPVIKVDGRVIGGGVPGPITRDLTERFHAITTTDGYKI